MLHLLMPNDAEISALLALMLLIDARAGTRLSATGRLLLLSEQDRTRWDPRLIDEGIALLTDALRRRPPTRYAVEAAIAAVHAEAPTWQDTDWAEIVGLYDVLLQLWPSPVVELNRAVALGLRDGPQAGLDALTPLFAEPALAAYGYLSAARADFLRQLAPVDAGGRGVRGGPDPFRQRRRTRLPRRAARRDQAPALTANRPSARSTASPAGGPRCPAAGTSTAAVVRCRQR